VTPKDREKRSSLFQERESFLVGNMMEIYSVQLATEQFRCDTRHVADATACHICLSPPRVSSSWFSFVPRSEFATESQCSEAELQNLISPNCHTATPKHSRNIAAEQIIARGLQSAWQAHYASAIDGKEFSAVACTATMCAGAQSTCPEQLGTVVVPTRFPL